jgi:hypothetical protein
MDFFMAFTWFNWMLMDELVDFHDSTWFYNKTMAHYRKIRFPQQTWTLSEKSWRSQQPKWTNNYWMLSPIRTRTAKWGVPNHAKPIIPYFWGQEHPVAAHVGVQNLPDHLLDAWWSIKLSIHAPSGRALPLYTWVLRGNLIKGHLRSRRVE